jgi:hypothetical protein
MASIDGADAIRDPMTGTLDAVFAPLRAAFRVVAANARLSGRPNGPDGPH